MKRRDFFKLSLVLGSLVLVPKYIYASELVLSEIQFSETYNQETQAQTLIIYLYGGASQLVGNLTNIEEIEKLSENSYYDYFYQQLTLTENKLWKEAGGDIIEELLSNNDMSLFRTCYSARREENDNKAHGLCTEENQKGTFDENAAGILTNLGEILESNQIINSETMMPFVTMEGESDFYQDGYHTISPYLKPMGIDANFDNPYYRAWVRRWHYYTQEERDSAPDTYSKTDEEGGFDPQLTLDMDSLSQKYNQNSTFQNFFSKRVDKDLFIQTLSTVETPDLGAYAYPDSDFAKKLETAIKLLTYNSQTKVLTLGTDGLGGWDDHNEASSYVGRMQNLWLSLQSAMAHLKAENKNNQINIMVFCEFGRNVNLNTSKGWDHGNLQNFYVLGGNGYFNHKGIVGETIVENTGSINRLYLKPKDGTYWFEPTSIAATLYKIYGIENPEIMTDGYGVIEPLFS